MGRAAVLADGVGTCPAATVPWLILRVLLGSCTQPNRKRHKQAPRQSWPQSPADAADREIVPPSKSRATQGLAARGHAGSVLATAMRARFETTLAAHIVVAFSRRSFAWPTQSACSRRRSRCGGSRSLVPIWPLCSQRSWLPACSSASRRIASLPSGLAGLWKAMRWRQSRSHSL